MYFSDAYPNLTHEEIHSSKTTERRLILCLVAVGVFSLAILGFSLS